MSALDLLLIAAWSAAFAAGAGGLFAALGLARYLQGRARVRRRLADVRR